jgi:HK97 gp10 family phage protein
MSAQISLKIKNLDVVRLLFKVAPQKMASELHTAIGRTVQMIERNAKREAPVNKNKGGGNLRQSIKSEMIGLAKGRVYADANYALFVHEGTRPHTIFAKNKRVLADRRNQKMFGRVVNHPGTQANPFLQRAVDSSQDVIDTYFIKAVQNVFK